MNKKTLYERILIGLKLGWNLPSLPLSVSNFHNYPLVRIFRVIGGVSIVLFLSPFNMVENYFFPELSSF